MAGASFTLPFLKKEQVAKDTYSFFFDRKKSKLDYLAGQYVRMILPHEAPDDRGTMRYFTIASSPSEKEHVMITTKVVKSTFKKTLCNLQKGDKVQFYGPSGSYVLEPANAKPHIFLSGGMGITPFRSMFTFASQKNLSTPITLIATFPAKENIVFFEELQNIGKKNPHFKIVFSITHPNKDWSGEKGRINDALLEKYISLTGDEVFYVCGPNPMVDDVRELLVESGVDIETINLEYFSGY